MASGHPAAGERHRRAHDLVTHLHKTVRTFRLYGPENAIVRRFIGELHDHILGLLTPPGVGAGGETAAPEGAVVRLDIRGGQFLFEGEPLQEGGVREGLAMALFRDGLTSLCFDSRVTPESLTRFLGLLCTNFAAVEVEGEDLVTLLWKEDLPGITHTSVLGLAETGPEGGDGKAAGGGNPGRPTGVTSEEVMAALAVLTAAGEGDATAVDGVEAAGPPTAPSPVLAEGSLLDDVAGAGGRVARAPGLERWLRVLHEEGERHLHRRLTEVVAEVLESPALRHFSGEEVGRLVTIPIRPLARAGDLGVLATYTSFLRSRAGGEKGAGVPQAEGLAAALASALDRETVQALVRVVAAAVEGAPSGPGAAGNALRDLYRVVAACGGRDLRPLLADLQEAPGTPDVERRILGELVVSLSRSDPDFLVQRVRRARSEALVPAFCGLLAVHPVAARDEWLARWRSPQARNGSGVDALALIEVLRACPTLYEPRLRDALLERAEGGGAIRVHACRLFARLRDATVVPSLWRWHSDRSFPRCTLEERVAVVETLVVLDPERAVPLCKDVLGRRRSRLFFPRPQADEERVVAARALAASDDRQAFALLSRLAEEGGAVAEVCAAAVREILGRRSLALLEMQGAGGETPAPGEGAAVRKGEP